MYPVTSSEKVMEDLAPPRDVTLTSATSVWITNPGMEQRFVRSGIGILVIFPSMQVSRTISTAF